MFDSGNEPDHEVGQGEASTKDNQPDQELNTEKHPLLASLKDAQPLKDFSLDQLKSTADEIRDVLCNLLATRTAHFASNLGVVELCLALHCEFDFRRDRLIWDTGHQVYPHKLITGRYSTSSTRSVRPCVD